MGYSRRPGCTSYDPFQLHAYTRGPLGHNDFADPSWPDCPPGDTPGPLGICDCGDPFFFTVSHLVEQLKREFKLLKGKITDTTESEYLDHVSSFFGSYIAYDDFSKESDKESNDTKGLRKLIELKGETQTIFYRWVRKAYINKGVKDVPGLIKRQQSKELADALKQVRAIYSKGFTAGGFNPRPMKNASYRYRLGTISEHGMGTAIDIEDATNPILSLRDWAFIENLTGTKPAIVRSLKRWQDKPEDLWQDIKDLNDKFVKAVSEQVKIVDEHRAIVRKNLSELLPKDKLPYYVPPWYAKHLEEEAKKGAKSPEPSVNIVLKDHPNLLKWVGGFFTLDKALVLVLHDHKFVWGATFSNTVDLHHFELQTL